MATGKSAFARHYDKYVAAFCLLVLAGAVYFWARVEKGAGSAREDSAELLDSLKPKNPKMNREKANDELAGYSNIVARIAKPFSMSYDPAVKTGFFVPERRVWCAQSSCQAPIPPNAEKCPRCGTEQPGKSVVVVDASFDGDGDGMPDEWERKYGLNPVDPSDAALDSDGDGFTNLEEFLAKTDPLDKASHTDLLTLLRVEAVEATKLPVKFMNTNLLPDGSYKCQFNYYDRETRQLVTIMVKDGDMLGPLPALPGAGISAPKRYADFKLVKLDWREENVTDKFTKKEKLTKVPVAVVQRISTGRNVEFRKEVETTDTDYKITFRQTHDDTSFTVEGGEGEVEFSVDGRKFLLKKVDKSAQSVVIVSKVQNKETTIPALGSGEKQSE